MTRRQILLALLPPLFFGTGFTIAKPAVQHFPPLFMMLMVYGGIALVLSLTQRERLKTPVLSIIAISAFAVTIQGALLFWGLKSDAMPATAANRYSTNETDLPGKAGWRQWDRERCERWAKRVGPDCADVVGRLFAAQRFDDQGVEPALAVLRLSRRYSERRLENACSLALQSVASPRYSHIRPILETGQDMTGGLTETSDDGAGGWVRGGDYYANMGR